MSLMLSQGSSQRRTRRPSLLGVEQLEDRCVPSGTTISGYVFNDLNANGLRDPGEPVIANSAVSLFNAAGQLIGTTVSNAQGYYEFSQDNTIPQTPLTQTHSFTVADRPTNSPFLQALPQFNPALGQLVGVDIQVLGKITSQIRAENLDDVGAQITATVQGSIQVTGAGLSVTVNTGSNHQNYQAGAYDGLTDYAGASGVTFAPKTVTGTSQGTVSNANLSAYVGTGTINITVTPIATSSASGGGNLQAAISSMGGAQIVVTYRYVPNNNLKPGTYIVRQMGLPPGYINGLLSRNGTVIPNSFDNRAMTVVLGPQGAPNNNFAHLLAAQIAGVGYIDVPNAGAIFSCPVGIGGGAVTLQGYNDRGQLVNITRLTAADGSYAFENLRPGSYQIVQGAAVGMLPGKINAPGTLGGSAQANRFTGIQLFSGAAGANYNFGWLKPATITGYVYADQNRNGLFDEGDRGIFSTWVLLTGVDDRGVQVQRVAWTGINGAYAFAGLRPGLYNVTHLVIPLGWRRGAINVGSLGGNQVASSTSSVALAVGDFGRDYNFGIEALGTGVGKGNFLGSWFRK